MSNVVCEYCKEPILDHETRAPILGEYDFHHACGFRMVSGSVEHIFRGNLPCDGTCQDPAGTTLRQGAELALQAWIATHHEQLGKRSVVLQ
jgi:hypothetical protein